MTNIYKKLACSSGIKAMLLSPWRCALYLVALMLISTVSLAQTGTVPVNPTSGGFKIDGGLQVNSAIGDWVAGSVGTGGYVFNSDGTILPGLMGKLIRDEFNNSSDIIFAEGSKFNSSPNDWSWAVGKATDKSDINNAMYLVTTDPATGDTWIIIGGDRMSTNGTSYIDFEFLQKPISRNSHNNKFTSEGTDGGRTVNDISITVGYSGGGSTPSVTAYLWQPAARGGFGYSIIPASDLEGIVFAATNTTVTNVPFLAFGNAQYQPFAFVEAAINISVLFGAINPCMGINVENVIVKTKASDAETAALKDFVEPIPVNMSFGTAEIAYNAPLCATGIADVTYTMGSARGGEFSASPAGLSINATTGQIDLEASIPGNYTVTYSFFTQGCPKSVTTDITILDSPDTPTLEATQPTCEVNEGTITVTSATEGLQFSLNGDDFKTYPANGFTGLAAGNYTVRAMNAAGCISAAEITIDNQPVTPHADAGDLKVLTCETQSVVLDGSSTTAGVTYMWGASDGGNIVSGANTATPTVNAAGMYTLTVTDPESGCKATAVTAVSVNISVLDVSISTAAGHPAITCDNPTVSLGSIAYIDEVLNPENAVYSWTGPNGFTSSELGVIVSLPGEYVLTVTNPDNGCFASAMYNVPDGRKYAEVDAGPDKVLNCSTASIALEGYTDNPAFDSFRWEASNGGHILSDAHTLTPIVDAAGTYTLIVTARGGCVATDVVVVTNNPEAPSANIYLENPPVLDCNTNSVRLAGSTELEDGAIYSWTGPEGFTSDEAVIEVSVVGLYRFTVTNTAMGCTSSVYQEVHDGRAYPDIDAGPDKVLTCDRPMVTLEGSSESLSGIMNYYWTASDGGNIVSGERTMNPVVNTPGTYTLTIKNMIIGCTSTDVVIVTRDESVPDITATGGTLNCATGSLQLTGSSTAAGASYSWSGPESFISDEQNPVVTVAGDYTLTVTANECSSSITVTVTPAATYTEPVITCHTIGFSYENYSRGLISTINTAEGPVAVMGRKRYPDGSYASENHAAIFDSQAPTGDDTDLYTTDWGNVLIINQDQTNVPNDNQWGGELILDFSAIGPVTMASLRALDIDSYEGMSWIYLYDAAGNELYRVMLQNLGDNSKQTVNLGNTKGVMSMRVVLDGRNEVGSLAGSGAIDDIRFCVEEAVEIPCESTQEREEDVNEMEMGAGNAFAYPVPFKDRTTIKFRLPKTQNYVVNLYDTKGMLIKQLKAGTAIGGEQNTVDVDGRNLPEGMYLARLVSDSGSKTIKLIINRK